MIGRVNASDIGKMSIFEFKVSSLKIHGVDKFFDSAGIILSQGQGGVIGRVNKETEKQICN